MPCRHKHRRQLKQAHIQFDRWQSGEDVPRPRSAQLRKNSDARSTAETAEELER